ncbi:MAG: GntR family transcriptional regulator [Candidatus Adiutrix sp.]|nr:GntR family transcriptional regulator [Candidatus Adiutrix sp.]
MPNKAAPDFSLSKNSHEPVYAQLATHLRQQIAEGLYPPGSQIPPEMTLSRTHGISAMTVRQAIGLLTDEGLLKRVQGRGTFVKSIEWQGSGFSLKPLAELVGQDGNTLVKVLKINTIRAGEDLAARLQVPPQSRLISIVRLLIRDGQPMLLQKGHLIYDPCLPLLEAELDVISLSGLFTGAPNRLIKKGELETLPVVLGEEEAALLEKAPGSAAFALEYLFWNFQDQPIGNGFFLVPQERMSLKARIGLWLE